MLFEEKKKKKRERERERERERKSDQEIISGEMGQAS